MEESILDYVHESWEWKRRPTQIDINSPQTRDRKGLKSCPKVLEWITSSKYLQSISDRNHWEKREFERGKDLVKDIFKYECCVTNWCIVFNIASLQSCEC